MEEFLEQRSDFSQHARYDTSFSKLFEKEAHTEPQSVPLLKTTQSDGKANHSESFCFDGLRA